MTELHIFEDEVDRLISLLNTRILDTPIDNRFERVTRLVQNVLNVPIASFNLIDKDRQWTKSSQGMSLVEIAREKSFCSHAIQTDATLIIPDARADDRFCNNPHVVGAPHIVFYAGCPVHAPDGYRIGSLCAIDLKPRQLSPREHQLLRDLAGVLESELRLDAILQKVDGLEQKLSIAESNARIDPLTRLANKAGAIDILKREWANGIRNKTPIAVALADIDQLKMINDKYGHKTGDEVLRQLSRLFLSVLRYEDAVGRIEGGEFILILPGCSQNVLFEAVERVRAEIFHAGIEIGKDVIPLSLSFGASGVVPETSEEMTELLEQSEKALMQAKKLGGNKTAVFNAGLMEAA